MMEEIELTTDSLAPIPRNSPQSAEMAHVIEQVPERLERLRMAELLRRISHANESLQLALVHLVEGTGATIEDIGPLIEVLKQPLQNYRVREAAAWALSALDLTVAQKEQARAALFDVIENRIPKPKWRSVRWLLQPTIESVPATILIWILLSAGGHVPLILVPIIFGVAHISLLLFLLPMFHSSNLHRINRVRSSSIRALSRLSRPDDISIFARAFGDSSPGVRDAASQAVMRTLPGLDESFRGRLDSDAVPNMCRLLDHWDVELAVSVLRTLEKIGDSRAIIAVQRLAETGSTLELREAAQKVAGVLRARKALDKDTHLLLRAAAESDHDTLLRPVSGKPESEPDTLLRPTNYETSEVQIVGGPRIQLEDVQDTVSRAAWNGS